MRGSDMVEPNDVPLDQSTVEDPRSAVIGVAMRDDRFLVIRRSPQVRAGGTWCLPGGTIEPNEDQPDAVRRELREELGLNVEPRRLIWHSMSPWATPLFWWSVDVLAGAIIRLNPEEVSACDWRDANELLADPRLLASAVPFLTAWERGEISWP